MKTRNGASILPLTLTLTTVLLAIGWALSGASQQSLRFTSREINQARARAAATSGLEYALLKLSQDPTFRGGPKPTLVGEGPERFRLRILDQNQRTPRGKAIPAGYLYIEASGEMMGVSPSRACALVNLQAGAGGVAGLPAIYGGSVTLDQSSNCDSYSSLEGFQQGRGAARIITNSESLGSIQLLQGSQVHGTVLIGPHGEINETIQRDEDASYTQAAQLQRPMDLNDVLLPHPAGEGEVEITRPDQVLAPGSYGRVVIRNGVSLPLASGIYVVRQLEISEGAQIDLLGDVPVQIYATESITIQGQSRLSQAQVRTSRLQLFLASGATYDQSAGSQVAGIVYGPAATLTLSDHATLFGSLVGDQVSVKESSSVFFDEQLKSFAMTLDPSAPTLSVLFREIP